MSSSDSYKTIQTLWVTGFSQKIVDELHCCMMHM